VVVSRIVLVLLISAAFLCGSSAALAKHRVIPKPTPDGFVQADDNSSIEDLIKDRINKEWDNYGTTVTPELVKTEANYARLSSSSRDVLYEASFHLQPRYISRGSTGPDTMMKLRAEQPIMYYQGSARTPLALPVVSNLSNALSGDEASYTINVGVLPLPYHGHETDSMKYYVVIERALESNHTDNTLRLERFAKEFVARLDEPVFLRLANEPLTKGAYIVRLENGSILDFYDDFSRFIEEHIVLNSVRLKFSLGHQTISDISERLSIPYSVARTSRAKVELLSVVDTAHSMTIIDTLRQPADYLAELDMSRYADGPYQYRFTAYDVESGKQIYSETHEFRKAAPVMVVGSRIGRADTLEVGGKKTDYAAMLRQLNEQYQREKVVNERISGSLTLAEREKHTLEEIVNANKKSTIADVHGRVGVGLGVSGGDNVFVGIESNKPALAFDVSFGMLYSGSIYLNPSTEVSNFSQILKSPRSLGFQLTWLPVKFFHGLIEPLISLGFFGIWEGNHNPNGWQTIPDPNLPTSATILSGQVGIACEPLGEVHGLGFSVSVGALSGLGVSSPSRFDWSFKTYVRF
jgi:hypothetical protein